MKKIVVVMWLLSFLIVSAAQSNRKVSGEKTRPDLSGTWIRDDEKSEFGNFKRRPYATSGVTILIEQAGAEVRITKKIKPKSGDEQEGRWLYYTDGRGETNPALFGQDELKSKTKWSGSKLVSEVSTRSRVSGDEIDLYMMEEWSLSSDSKRLISTIWFERTTTTKIGGGGEMIHKEKETIRQIFNRAP